MDKRFFIYFGGMGVGVLIAALVVFFIYRGYVTGDPVFERSLANANGDVVEALKDCGRCELNEAGEIERLFLYKTIERGSPGRPKPPLKHNNAVIKHVKNVDSIKHLGISPLTDIDKRALDDIAEMTQLQSLDLNGFDVDDDSLRKLKTLTNLQTITLYVTEVSESGVREFIKDHPGCEVRWGNMMDSNNPALPTIRAVQESKKREEERERLRNQPLRK